MVKMVMQNTILDAAKKRFNYYGFQKTTMAEIAQDCAMSAANLYRYFDSKSAIGAALVAEVIAEKEAILAEIVESDAPAAEKLDAFILAVLHHAHRYFESMPKISELIDAVMVDNVALVVKHRYQKMALIEQILLQGQTTGEFEFEDLAGTVDAIHSAILIFYLPLTLGLYPLPELENKAHNVSVLLLNGLRSTHDRGKVKE